MAIQTTQFSPDTCSCVVEYEWDDAVPVELRTHRVSRIVSRDARHAALVVADAHYAQILGENQRKNRAIGHAVEAFPALLNADGDFRGTWSFTLGHVLLLTLPGVNRPSQLSVQSWCDLNLGIGLVVVN